MRQVIIGLFWGGDFKNFVDRPHFEYPAFLPGNSTRALKDRYIKPESFFYTWKEAGKIELTIKNMLADGVASDAEYWRRYLLGLKPTNPVYVRTVLDRYNAKVT